MLCVLPAIQVIVHIPDEFVSDPVQPGEDAGRAALEAWVVNEYRLRRLMTEQVRWLLGFETRFDFDPFLLKHQTFDYTVADLAVLERFDR